MKSYKEIGAWLLFEPFYDHVIETFIKDGMKLIEIGNWQGGSVIYLAQKIKERGFKNVEIQAVDITDAGQLKNVEDCGVSDMVKVHIMPSCDLAARFDNDYFDFVFIDGDHSYEGVKKDIVSYWPKLKVGGIMGGDDYNNPLPGIVGITKSVHDIFGQSILTWPWKPCNFQGCAWYLNKTKDQTLILTNTE